MTNQEINEAVARKLGWHYYPVADSKKYVQGPLENPINVAEQIPDFCNDIKAAWDIVEYVNAEKFELIKTNALAGVGCSFKFQPGYPEDLKVFEYSAYAETVAKCICAAFLKLDK